MLDDNSYPDLWSPLPPAEPIQPALPLKEGPYEYDANGLRIKGFAASTPAEIIAEIHSQYDGPPKQYGGARFVAARRKSKQFFQVRICHAHLLWYGVKFPPNAGIRDLEVWLAREMLREEPAPQISAAVRAIETDMRQRFESSGLDSTQSRTTPDLPDAHTLDLALSQEVYIECDANDFLTDPEGFPGLYFGTDTPEARVVVLQRLPETYRQFADETLCDKHGLKSVHLPTTGCRGTYYDIVVSQNAAALATKVIELGSSQSRGRSHRHGT
ncbi:hypothetical protein CALVIDRAFT_529180 [Calocera viscosa TUFC12733]|uniref:Uncharacterized protein n=1 Tax=Calocera viscosa (strain TUFC12733) TaxID=1330018 RepID=A0A167JU96_CALVF|nr:hypothetical protein CALVIDRAFT_529180 [Calocera viscosa TUFC12733]